uniref:Uncharacterized protein n=1 Tax=Knipowitschia caucasica TaxID=637954 RepID=A0AAV2KNW8_KNICA
MSELHKDHSVHSDRWSLMWFTRVQDEVSGQSPIEALMLSSSSNNPVRNFQLSLFHRVHRAVSPEQRLSVRALLWVQ